jgi:hypothetical protein
MFTCGAENGVQCFGETEDADHNAHWNGIVGRYLGQWQGLKSLCLGFLPRQVGVGENKMKFYRIQTQIIRSGYWNHNYYFTAKIYHKTILKNIGFHHQLTVNEVRHIIKELSLITLMYTDAVKFKSYS